jgi:disulfide bond formation protein DsbB
VPRQGNVAALLASRPTSAHTITMPVLSIRTLALLTAIAAGAALGGALASEAWDGLVPCALCLVERWPYRIAIVLGLLALVVPPRAARVLLALAALTVLAGAAVAFVHVGVEAHWWPSPLPECAAPHFAGGSIAQRLASMPVKAAKPCDEPSYLIPGLPVSMAMMNLLFALAFAGLLAFFTWRSERRPT